MAPLRSLQESRILGQGPEHLFLVQLHPPLGQVFRLDAEPQGIRRLPDGAALHGLLGQTDGPGEFQRASRIPEGLQAHILFHRLAHALDADPFPGLESFPRLVLGVEGLPPTHLLPGHPEPETGHGLGGCPTHK